MLETQSSPPKNDIGLNRRSMARYPEARSHYFRSPMLLLCRALEIVICFGLGTFSLYFTGPEMKRADASVSLFQRIAGVVVVGGVYFAIGWIATIDIRWSSVLAIGFAVFSTP